MIFRIFFIKEKSFFYRCFLHLEQFYILSRKNYLKLSKSIFFISNFDLLLFSYFFSFFYFLFLFTPRLFFNYSQHYSQLIIEDIYFFILEHRRTTSNF